MKRDNQAVMDEIVRKVMDITINQRRLLLQAMSNPYFYLIAFKLARADERHSEIAFRLLNALIDDGKEESKT